jgi:hypothetical protein
MHGTNIKPIQKEVNTKTGNNEKVKVTILFGTQLQVTQNLGGNFRLVDWYRGYGANTSCVPRL